MKPSVGRIVHWVDTHGQCVAALVYAVPDEPHTALLTIFQSGIPLSHGELTHQDEHGRAAGTWHWPERVE